MKNTENIFEELIGEKLSSITFVMDYIQLSFDGPTINVYAPILVKDEITTTRCGEDQFRNQICSFIAKQVKEVTFAESESIYIYFEDHSQIQISLRESDYTGPEAIECHNFKNNSWLVV